MRVEHVIVGIIIFLIVLLAIIALSGKAVPIFSQGLDQILRSVGLK